MTIELLEAIQETERTLTLLELGHEIDTYKISKVDFFQVLMR